MGIRIVLRLVIVAASCLVLPAIAYAQDVAITKEDIDIGEKEYSPYLHQSLSQPRVSGATRICTRPTRPMPA